YHSGRHEFSNLDRYRKALDARYGPSAGLEEFARKAQLANYEAMRPMFEAFSLRRPLTKGVVQWMLNSAWPKLFWQLYDWYLVPNGAYYAARNANRPLHVAYDYGKRQVVAVNDTASDLRGATARVRVYDGASRLLLDQSQPLVLPAGERSDVLALGPLAKLAAPGAAEVHSGGSDGKAKAAAVYFLDARIEDGS